jgi:hypothetical protein
MAVVEVERRKRFLQFPLVRLPLVQPSFCAARRKAILKMFDDGVVRINFRPERGSGAPGSGQAVDGSAAASTAGRRPTSAARPSTRSCDRRFGAPAAGDRRFGASSVVETTTNARNR